MANKTTKFLGKDLMTSPMYAEKRDILTALLKPEKLYSKEEVEKIIERFNKTKA